MIMYTLLLLFSSLKLFSCEALTLKTFVEQVPRNIEAYIGADIGGTNSRFGIFELQDRNPTLLFSLHKNTKKITDFNAVMNDVINYAHDNYNITINHACIAAPGVATENKDFASVHGLFDIKTKKLIKKTPLKTAIIVNDLFVVGHGIDHINENNIVKMYGTQPKQYATRAIIGIGTGLGSSTMTWNEKTESYVTHAGEAGLLEFAPNNQEEYNLANHLKQLWDGKNPICWGNLVSGSGIRRIYSILKLINKYHDSLQLDSHDPAIIFAHPEDELCKAAMNLFFKLHARFLRNYVFTILPHGGLYITGGVAAKNAELFSKFFIDEYENCGKLQEILKNIPIYLITDSNVSLYGAISYLLLEKIHNNSNSKDT